MEEKKEITKDITGSPIYEGDKVVAIGDCGNPELLVGTATRTMRGTLAVNNGDTYDKGNMHVHINQVPAYPDVVKLDKQTINVFLEFLRYVAVEDGKYYFSEGMLFCLAKASIDNSPYVIKVPYGVITLEFRASRYKDWPLSAPEFEADADSAFDKALHWAHTNSIKIEEISCITIGDWVFCEKTFDPPSRSTLCHKFSKLPKEGDIEDLWQWLKQPEWADAIMLRSGETIEMKQSE